MIWDHVVVGPNPTTPNLLIEMSVATVDRAIKKLTEAGLIRRVGANRNGSWEITDPQQRTV